ncbi:MAG: ferredoxin [Rhodobacteraceae bacterium]|nr:ferredoxin [Paracoccaceae bacterium]
MLGAVRLADDETTSLGLPPMTRGLALFGYDGPTLWAAFSTSPEAADGAPHPLDRWSKRAGDALAHTLGAQAFYPSDTPLPPFLRWARRVEAVWPSPLGMLINRRRGLWSGYRAALAVPGPLGEDWPDAPPPASPPCESCAGRPCLTACPVDAFGPDGYDVDACAAHLRHPDGAACRSGGCLARRACPVGRDFAHNPAQAAFHMTAFMKARSAGA